MVRAVLVSFVIAAPAVAQTRPDFSGVWEFVDVKITPPPPAETGSMALPPGTLAIRQTPTVLEVEREGFSQPIIYKFLLDGAESRNASGAMTLTTRSRWDGPRLVTEGTQTSNTSQGFSKWLFKETRFLEKGQLIIETRTETGKDVRTTRQVWKRRPATDPAVQ